LVVRIINDKIYSGSLYNKKVQIANIVNEYDFLIVDGNKHFTEICESDLETVLPPSKEYKSAIVIILKGEFKGE